MGTAAAASLAWLSRHAGAAFAFAMVLALAVPPVADAFRPLLAPALVANMVTAILRLDLGELRAYLRRPWLIGAIVAVSTVAVPLLVVAATRTLSLDDSLESGLVLLALAPTVISAVGFCAVLGLDVALVITVMVVGHLFVPLTLPPLALLLLGIKVEIGLFEMMGRLALFVGLSGAIAFALRRWVLSPAVLARHRRQVEGLGVLTIMFVGIAIMAGVTRFVVAAPAEAALMLAALFVVNPALQLFGAAAFWRLGPRPALTIGLATAYTNLAIVMAALGDGADAALRAFFGLGQIPMFVLPLVTLPLFRRLIARRGGVPVRP